MLIQTHAAVNDKGNIIPHVDVNGFLLSSVRRVCSQLAKGLFCIPAFLFNSLDNQARILKQMMHSYSEYLLKKRYMNLR